MLKIFRNNQLTTLIFVFIYGLCLMASYAYTEQESYVEEFTRAQSVLTYFFSGLTLGKGASALCFLVVVFLQGVYLNYLLSKYDLIKEQNYFTALLYTVLNFSFFQGDFLSPVLLGNTFLIVALDNFYQSFSRRHTFGLVFNIGFCIGLASLCYFSTICLVVWGFLLISRFKSFRPIDVVMYSIACLLPWFWIGVYAYLNDIFASFIYDYALLHFSHLKWALTLDVSTYISLALLLFLLLSILANLPNLYAKTSSMAQSNLNVLLLMLPVLALSFLFQAELGVEHFTLFILPLAILLSINFNSYKSHIASELVHFVIFMLCFGIQYQNVFFTEGF